MARLDPRAGQTSQGTRLGGFSSIKSPVTRRMAEAMPTKAATEVGAEAELTPAEAAGAMKAASETPGREPGGAIPMKSVPVKGSKQGATRELDPRTGKPLAIAGREVGAVKRPFRSRWQPPSPAIARVRALSQQKRQGGSQQTGQAAG